MTMIASPTSISIDRCLRALTDRELAERVLLECGPDSIEYQLAEAIERLLEKVEDLQDKVDYLHEELEKPRKDAKEKKP